MASSYSLKLCLSSAFVKGIIRQSSDQFWIELLKEFGLPYEVVSSSSRERRLDVATVHVNTLLHERFDPMRAFIREVA